MSGGYNPAVSRPDVWAKFTRSPEFQTPFFFGASQVPNALFLPKSRYNGSKGEGIASKADLESALRPEPIYSYRTYGKGVYKHHKIKRANVMPFMK